MARQHIYTVLTHDGGRNYECVKMERDFEPVETYHISNTTGRLECTCFASNKSVCRHRTLVAHFIAEGAVNSRRAYDFDKNKWVEQPNTEV